MHSSKEDELFSFDNLIIRLFFELLLGEIVLGKSMIVWIKGGQIIRDRLREVYIWVFGVMFFFQKGVTNHNFIIMSSMKDEGVKNGRNPFLTITYLYPATTSRNLFVTNN